MEIKPLISEDFIVLNDESTLSKMIGRLKESEKRTGLVFKNKKYLGIVEKKKLLKSRLDTSVTKIKNFVQQTPIISEHADLIETAYLMHQSNLHYLPVKSNKQIIGVLNAINLAQKATELPELKKVKVEDLKLLKPVKINKNDPVATVMKIMYQERIDQLPVFDEGKLYGIISFRDLLRKYLNWSPKRDNSAKFNVMARSRIAKAEMPQLALLPVENFSTNDNLLTIKPGEPLIKAIELMHEKKNFDILVMDDGNFVGLLTMKNILRKLGSLKVPTNFNIRFIGLNKLKLQAYEVYNIRKISGNESFKIQRKIKNEFDLSIHLKEYDKEGGKHKYSVNIRVEYPGQMISANQEDRDVETALRKSFENIKNNLDNKLR